ncbi:unnamed protein product, partial [marine sediment metagenome]
MPYVESDEYVEITNLGDQPQELTGCVLMDISEGYPSFTFPSYILAPGKSIRVYTNECHPEWGGFSFEYSQPIWNNSEPDVAVLYDNQGKDIRQLGDGNMGARNAFRELGAKVGVAIFFIDASKGVLAILIAQAANIPQVAILFTGAAAVVGHNWPVFTGFRGGRGESTTIGALLALITQPMLIIAGPAVLTLFIRKNVTTASCVLFIPLPLVCWWLGAPGSLISYSMALPC